MDLQGYGPWALVDRGPEGVGAAERARMISGIDDCAATVNAHAVRPHEEAEAATAKQKALAGNG